MRARNIKPGFFTNELLGTYDPIISLFFAGLWCIADRNGILEYRPLRIKAELFPYREGVDINGYLTVLERDGFVTRYEVDGKHYIQVNNFNKHQSPHHTEKPKGYPQHHNKTQGLAGKRILTPLNNGEITVPKRSDSLIPDSLIQLHSSSAMPDDGFEEFWKSYPRKVGKGAARKAWSKIKKKGELLPVILAALTWQRESPNWKKDGGQFVPHPSTWLNEQRWLDEQTEPNNMSSDWRRNLL